MTERGFLGLSSSFPSRLGDQDSLPLTYLMNSWNHENFSFGQMKVNTSFFVPSRVELIKQVSNPISIDEQHGSSKVPFTSNQLLSNCESCGSPEKNISLKIILIAQSRLLYSADTKILLQPVSQFEKRGTASYSSISLNVVFWRRVLFNSSKI